MSANVRVAILASGDRASGGGGSTADRFARDILEGSANIDIGVVICDNPIDSVGVYGRFNRINKEFGLKGDRLIEVKHIGPANYPIGKQERGQTLTESSAICKLLGKRDIGFIAMLGYLRILTGELEETWAWQSDYADDPVHGFRQGIYNPSARIINNHPGILPFTADTYGHGTHKKAIQLYEQGIISHSAMTWHLASKEIDKGPIIREEPVAIEPGYDADKLAAAVQDREKELTSSVIAAHLILRQEHLRGNS